MFSRRGRIEVKKYPKFEDKRQVVGHVASTEYVTGIGKGFILP